MSRETLFFNTPGMLQQGADVTGGAGVLEGAANLPLLHPLLPHLDLLPRNKLGLVYPGGGASQSSPASLYTSAPLYSLPPSPANSMFNVPYQYYTLPLLNLLNEEVNWIDY